MNCFEKLLLILIFFSLFSCAHSNHLKKSMREAKLGNYWEASQEYLKALEIKPNEKNNVLNEITKIAYEKKLNNAIKLEERGALSYAISIYRDLESFHENLKRFGLLNYPSLNIYKYPVINFEQKINEIKFIEKKYNEFKSVKNIVKFKNFIHKHQKKTSIKKIIELAAYNIVRYKEQSLPMYCAFYMIFNKGKEFKYFLEEYPYDKWKNPNNYDFSQYCTILKSLKNVRYLPNIEMFFKFNKYIIKRDKIYDDRYNKGQQLICFNTWVKDLYKSSYSLDKENYRDGWFILPDVSAIVLFKPCDKDYSYTKKILDSIKDPSDAAFSYSKGDSFCSTVHNFSNEKSKISSYPCVIYKIITYSISKSCRSLIYKEFTSSGVNFSKIEKKFIENYLNAFLYYTLNDKKEMEINIKNFQEILKKYLF